MSERIKNVENKIDLLINNVNLLVSKLDKKEDWNYYFVTRKYYTIVKND